METNWKSYAAYRMALIPTRHRASSRRV